MDGSGKTTIARHLARSLGATYIRNPPDPFDFQKPSILERASPMARLVYFLASNIQASALAERHLKTSHVVLDRHIWSTWAYHAAIEGINPKSLISIAPPISRYIRMPDLVVYLSVSRKEQLRRLRGRHEDRLQRMLLKSSQFQRRLRSAYNVVRDFWPLPWVQIDTSRASAKTIIDSVEKVVRQYTC